MKTTILILLATASISCAAPVIHEAAVQSAAIRKADAQAQAVKQGPTKRETALKAALVDVRKELQSVRSLVGTLQHKIADRDKKESELNKQIGVLSAQVKDSEAFRARESKRADNRTAEVLRWKQAYKSKLWGRIHIIMLSFPFGLALGFILGFFVKKTSVEKVYIPAESPTHEPPPGYEVGTNAFGDKVFKLKPEATPPPDEPYPLPPKVVLAYPPGDGDPVVTAGASAPTSVTESPKAGYFPVEPRPKKPKTPKAPSKGAGKSKR